MKVLNCKKETLVDEIFGMVQTLDTAYVAIAEQGFEPGIADFSHNAIDSLEKDRIVPRHERSVQKLDFSYNGINYIEDDAFNRFTQLRVLKLSRNDLGSHGVHRAWLTVELGRTLHQLYLDGNGITQLPYGVFDNLYNLKRLVLDGNSGLQISRQTFGLALEFLEELSLDYCDISSLDDDTFDSLKNLKSLSLIGNPLTTVPYAIRALPQLSALDMSATHIRQFVENDFRNNTNLQELLMKDMPRLCILDLSNSIRLQSISSRAFGDRSSEELGKPSHLRQLNVANCNLSTLDKRLLNWNQIERLQLEGNPLVCDGNMGWLTDGPFTERLLMGSAATCAYPRELKGVPLNYVEKYKTTAQQRKRLLVVALFVVALVLTIAVTIYCLRKIRAGQQGYNTLGTQRLILDDDVVKPEDV
ncbi:Protein LRON-7 a [Aphelenchoides avenae]|nr:Protein LRON-7 a [Aphelenchus avenae]